MSEIYNRPVEIYSHSKEPLKTFHETQNSFIRGLERENKFNNIPIRITYHGRAHYNSLVPKDNYDLFKNSLINMSPGEYENTILEKAKLKNLQKTEEIDYIAEKNIATKINLPIFSNKKILKNIDDEKWSSINIQNKRNEEDYPAVDLNLEISREGFLAKSKIYPQLLTILPILGMKDLDKILEEKLSATMATKEETPVITNDNVNLNEALKQSESSAVEDEILKSVIELSIQDKRKTADINVNKNEEKITEIPAIKFVIEIGFTLEEAIMAYSAVGDDPDLMLQYLYSLNMQ